MHSKTDSEVASISALSAIHSPPRRAAYYVQSPSHDGEKTALLHSTPVLSPMASPPLYHSRESSTRFSDSFKPAANGPHEVPPNDAVSGGKKLQRPWKEYEAIKEEGVDEDEETQKPLPRCFYFLAFILGFFALFSLFSLILWSAARPQKPQITMKSITFEIFVISAGSDSTGVATEMASVNATLKFLYRNTANFFGFHVTSTPIDLSYSQITVATGNEESADSESTDSWGQNPTIWTWPELGDIREHDLELHSSIQSLRSWEIGKAQILQVYSMCNQLGPCEVQFSQESMHLSVMHDPK